MFAMSEGLTLTPAVLRVELTSMQTPRSDPTLCGPSGGHSEDAATKTFCIAPPPARRRNPGLRQWIAAVIVNMLYMAEAAGYLAKQKIIFSQEDDMPSIRRSINVSMWVAGILSFLLHFIILQLLKRKFHIIIICIVYYATALAMSIDTDNSYKTNYFISVLWAIASTGTMMFVSVYISETTPDHTRGKLIAIKTLFRYLVFSFSLLKYPLIPHSWLVIAIPTVVLLSCFWLPETPVFLLRRGNVDATKQSLRRLHGNAAEVEQEVEKLRTLLKATHSDTNNTIAALRKFSNIRTLGYSGLAIILSLLDFLSGVVLAEGNIMVQNIGVGKGQLLPMLIINLIIFISCTMTGLLMCDRIGHRKTLLVSIVVCSVALLLNGIWYWNVDSFWVLSIIAFLLAALHFFGYSFGMSFLPTAITIDIFPPSLLYILLAITGIISWPFYSDRNISLSIYNYTFDTIYIYLLLLSAVCALTVPLVYFLLPETTNKHVGALLLENRVVNTTCPDNKNSRSNKYNECNSSSTSPQA
ncbi:hypothetical protein R5R35_010573 [Gryllus longicercus]|uniref:Sugar transporter n=1 Tax=Gryllus longicercus TaxID=2509291 RepID=A0AAN9VEL8_9ORTH